MTAALERAHLVRSVADVLSSDEPIAQLWPRCCSLLAALAGSERVTIALREPTGDRYAYVFSADAPPGPLDAPIRAGTLAGDVMTAGETIVRGDGEKLAIGVPIHFGRSTFGAICFDRIVAYDAEDVTLLESCALYAGARLYHESAVQSSERYARLAFTDALTGIANRRSFDENFVREWARAMRDHSSVAILMLDLDFFKSYNDGYGHQAGDACLQKVATALAGCIKRPGDLLARYGGEEFVALLPDTDVAGATALAEDLREAVTTLAIVHEGSSLGHLSASIGAAAAVPETAGGSAGLLHSADDGLYRAKLGGRNRVYADGYESQSATTRPRRMAQDHNLPVSLTRLIGRRTEIEQARGLLSDHRLVSIVGTGGTGKTRVAIAVANELAERFDDGVRFVDLSSIADPLLVASTIASLFGADVPMDESATEALADALNTKSTLLVFDNCEHITEAAGALTGALLRRCPHLCVLATSREPLGIAGEAVYRLPLLSMPPPSVAPDAAQAMKYDAVNLFVERATEANRTFALTDANVDAVVQICRDVDGIALAIEIAASHIGAIGLGQLAQRLRGVRLLGGGDRSAAPRQQTMHAMIDWSHTLLSEAERAVFRRLAIFQGGFTFESSTAVCASPPIAGRDVFELLSSLIRKSLVSEDPTVPDRYRLLESVRAFARERLADAGELQRVSRLHAEYFDEFAHHADESFRVTPSREWIAGILPEIDNLRAALEWTLEERGDVLLGASIAAASNAFFYDVKPAEAVRTVIRTLECLPPGAAPAIEAKLNLRLATSQVLPKDITRAAGERAVELYRDLKDRAGLSEALRVLAETIGWHFRPERELADALACESIDIARTLNDPIRLALALRTRGLTIDISDFPKKRAVLEESLALLRLHGTDLSIGIMLTWISELEFSAGDWPRALGYGREAVRYSESADSRRLITAALTNLSNYSAALEDWETARAALVQSIASSRRIYQAEQLTFSIQAAACVATGNGRDDDAARLIGWCDERMGTLHAGRQADQSEDIMYRRLMDALRSRVDAAALATLMREGAAMNEDEAAALALSV
jgi:diguanylate cyclase (GGDEF)-like protein